AWEDFLDMTCGQANLWCANNVEPEKVNSEIMPTEPYLLGSHSGCCGVWAGGPMEDWNDDSYKTGYNRMTTVNGLFIAGDVVGASGHKFSSGSHAEGRIAAKAMVQYVTDNADYAPAPTESAQEIVDYLWQPVRLFLDNYEYTTMNDVNPNYIKPSGFSMRMMKATNEYGGGWATYYQTSGKNLEILMDMFKVMHEDSFKLGAGDLHELLRAHEMRHRLWTVEAHNRHIQFREESRYPGFYYRADFPNTDDANWFCYTNSRFDPKTGEWNCFKKDYVKIVPD
ncbi:MAG: adenylylsulfate reductase subunit alpha, partial [Thermodesulfobacteriota bacterium]|nr:adenylylsulfate reductase subunit alpha [Thermodesulfobacteriota bacterium]